MTSKSYQEAYRFILTLPHIRALGLEIEVTGRGSSRGILRGGELAEDDPGHAPAMTFLDTVLGAAAAADESGSINTPATLDLRVDFIAAPYLSQPLLPPTDEAALVNATASGAGLCAIGTVQARRAAISWVTATLYRTQTQVSTSAASDRVSPWTPYARATGSFMMAPSPLSQDQLSDLTFDWFRRDRALGGASLPLGAEAYRHFLDLRYDDSIDSPMITIPFRPALIGNPGRPTLHGGVNAALLYEAATITLLRADRCHAAAATVGDRNVLSHTVQYLSAARPQELHACATIIHHGRQMAMVTAQAWQDDIKRPIAMAQTLFMRDPQLPLG